MPKPVVPQMDFQTIRALVEPAFTIAILCAIESLLAAMVADGVTGKQHDSNTELIGQGIANIVTPLFGGIPATGALARTMASINNGARTSVAGLVHSVVLLLIFLFLMPYVIYVPLGCLAAILIVVAYNMSEWRSFKYLLKGEKSDIAVLLLTFFLTVVVDLTVAIEVGILLAIVLFVRRTMQTSSIRVIDEASIAASEDDEIAASDDIERLDIHKGIEIYEICRTEEDADEDDSPMPAEGRSGVALGIPQHKHHNEHHEALIDVVPALHHHTVEPYSTFILRCHEVFVVESADSTEHSGKDDEIYPLVVFEVDALLLAASAEHEKGCDSQRHTNPLINVEPFAKDEQGSHQYHYRTGGIDWSDDSERQMLHTEISEYPGGQYDKALADYIFVDLPSSGCHMEYRPVEHRGA